MTQADLRNDINVTRDGYVAIVEIARPPHNFFDIDLIHTLADVFDELDEDPDARAIVLASQGKNFCAGNDFSAKPTKATHPAALALEGTFSPLYAGAVRLFSNKKPIVGAIQGAAVGGGVPRRRVSGHAPGGAAADRVGGVLSRQLGTVGWVH